MTNDGKSRGSFNLGPTDKQWLQYVIGLSLLNLWIAILWLSSSPKPLRDVVTDGSLLVYCTVTMWLTLASLRQELKRSEGQRTSTSALWSHHDRLLGWAVVISLLATVFYTQFIAQEDAPSTLGRSIASAVGVIAGAWYARTALATTHEVAHSEVEVQA